MKQDMGSFWYYDYQVLRHTPILNMFVTGSEVREGLSYDPTTLGQSLSMADKTQRGLGMVKEAVETRQMFGKFEAGAAVEDAIPTAAETDDIIQVSVRRVAARAMSVDVIDGAEVLTPAAQLEGQIGPRLSLPGQAVSRLPNQRLKILLPAPTVRFIRKHGSLPLLGLMRERLKYLPAWIGQRY